MLAHIHISNLGIINDLEIDFEKGFNVMTGETGAGKTLIIGAIAMILGGKVNISSLDFSALVTIHIKGKNVIILNLMR